MATFDGKSGAHDYFVRDADKALILDLRSPYKPVCLARIQQVLHFLILSIFYVILKICFQKNEKIHTFEISLFLIMYLKFYF